MRQTLVQLTDDLVERLDRRAQRWRKSRSWVVRELLERALSEREAIDQALVEGYTSQPQADAWGDLDEFTAANAAANMRALDAEDGGW